MIRFVLTATIVGLAIGMTGYFVFEKLPAFFYPTIILLFTSTVGLFRFLLKTRQDNPGVFVQLYLATIAIKLIAYAVYIFYMVKKQPEMRAENVVFFMVSYVIFTALETVFLYRFVSR